MKLECRGYEGPFLPKETHARSLPSDSRVLRTSKKLVGPLGEVVGDIRRISPSAVKYGIQNNNTNIFLHLHKDTFINVKRIV